MIRAKHIASYLQLSLGSRNDPVSSAMVKPIVVSRKEPFLNVEPRVIEAGCVLILTETKKLGGSITTKDLGSQLLEIVTPFVSLSEIERLLRALVKPGDFAMPGLLEMLSAPTGNREVHSVADLTLGRFMGSTNLRHKSHSPVPPVPQNPRKPGERPDLTYLPAIIGFPCPRLFASSAGAPEVLIIQPRRRNA